MKHETLCFIKGIFKLIRLLLIIIVCFISIGYILYGMFKLIVGAEKRAYQESEMKKMEVFHDKKYGTWYIIDVPIQEKNHQYLIYYNSNLGSDSMIHYPECKYCKKKGYTK